jgi:uncharacterized membrane protein YgcG
MSPVSSQASTHSRLSWIAILCFVCALATGADTQGMPKHEGWVNDTANVLSAPDRGRISDTLSRFHAETFHQVAILTVPTVSGEGIAEFSLRVANSWQLAIGASTMES